MYRGTTSGASILTGNAGDAEAALGAAHGISAAAVHIEGIGVSLHLAPDQGPAEVARVGFVKLADRQRRAVAAQVIAVGACDEIHIASIRSRVETLRRIEGPQHGFVDCADDLSVADRDFRRAEAAVVCVIAEGILVVCHDDVGAAGHDLGGEHIGAGGLDSFAFDVVHGVDLLHELVAGDLDIDRIGDGSGLAAFVRHEVAVSVLGQVLDGGAFHGRGVDGQTVVVGRGALGNGDVDLVVLGGEFLILRHADGQLLQTGLDLDADGEFLRGGYAAGTGDGGGEGCHALALHDQLAVLHSHDRTGSCKRSSAGPSGSRSGSWPGRAAWCRCCRR